MVNMGLVFVGFTLLILLLLLLASVHYLREVLGEEEGGEGGDHGGHGGHGGGGHPS